MQNTITKLGLLAALITTVCAAQQTAIQKEGSNWVSVVSGSLSGVRNLHIQVEIGAVHIQGGSTQGINYVIRNRSYEGSEDRARKQFEAYKISTNVRGDTAFITGEWENGKPHKFNSEVTVNVPRDLDLVRIETDGGEISTTGISGRLEAQSGGGGIHLDDIGGAISAETGGGSIDVGNVGSDLTVRTGGGTIHIGSAKGKVVAESGGGSLVLVSGAAGASLQTGGGSIHVDKCSGEVRAETGGGSIDLGEIGGSVSMETGGGTLKVSSATGPIKGETGSGNIELWGVPSAQVETGSGAITAKFIRGGNGTSNSELETGVGDITVYLVSNVNLTVRASIEAANGQQIVSDFPEIKISSEGGGQWGPKLVSAEGSVNGGGPVLKVRTTMGNIYFRRAQ
jgi:hypothetical protein